MRDSKLDWKADRAARKDLLHETWNSAAEAKIKNEQFGGRAMSETPQEIVERFLTLRPGIVPKPMEEAIRAMLAEVEKVKHDSAEWSTIANHKAELLEQAEAERDACHKVGERIMAAVKPRQNELVAEAVERVVAERDALRAEVAGIAQLRDLEIKHRNEVQSRAEKAEAARDEARLTKDMHKERQEEAWAEVERLTEEARLNRAAAEKHYARSEDLREQLERVAAERDEWRAP
jgi:hypothetical protein